MSTFTYLPSYPLDADESPRVRANKFGDGYEQRQAESMNPLAEIYPLQFNNRSPEEATDILTFLRARGGVESFQWTPPDSEVEGTYICRSWKRSRAAPNAISISATFEQVFEP